MILVDNGDSDKVPHDGISFTLNTEAANCLPRCLLRVASRLAQSYKSKMPISSVASE